MRSLSSWTCYDWSCTRHTLFKIIPVLLSSSYSGSYMKDLESASAAALLMPLTNSIFNSNWRTISNRLAKLLLNSWAIVMVDDRYWRWTLYHSSTIEIHFEVSHCKHDRPKLLFARFVFEFYFGQLFRILRWRSTFLQWVALAQHSSKSFFARICV